MEKHVVSKNREDSMDKIGHLVITKSLSGNLQGTHKAALLIGSVLPDFLVYTYLTGHTWEATFEQITKQMESLEEKGRGRSFSYLKLGWMLHYVEDYFTYPHNTIFEGTIPEHYAYEKKMTKWMREGALDDMPQPVCKKLDSAAQVSERLQELHDRYLQEEMCYENDTAYMRQMVLEIMNCYAEIFVRKNEFAHFMGWVRKKVGIMIGFVS